MAEPKKSRTGNWRLERLKKLEEEAAALKSKIPDRRDFTSKENYLYAVEGANRFIRKYQSIDKRIAKLKTELGSKYIQRNKGLGFSNLLFDPLPGMSGAESLRIRNPQYVSKYDTSGEEALTNQRDSEALKIGALEREEDEWGPGGQPSASYQLSIAGGGSGDKSNQSTGPTVSDTKAASGLQAWYRGGPRTLSEARADTKEYFKTSGWGSALKGLSQTERNEIGKAFRGGYATVFTNKGGKDFLHYKGRVYSKPTQGG